MGIGFIGYGQMARALGSRWARGHDLLIGGRDAGKAEALAESLGGGTRARSTADASAHGEVVMLARRHLAVFDAIGAAGGPGAFAGLIAEIGAEPVRVGLLAHAHLLESAAAIVIRFLFAGRDPHTVLNLIQSESRPIA
jgi:hypothetical protein